MSTLRNRGPPAGPCGAAELHKLSKQQANYISNECQGSAQRKCQGSARSLTVETRVLRAEPQCCRSAAMALWREFQQPRPERVTHRRERCQREQTDSREIPHTAST
jgi:hypothetical protein